MKGKQSEPVKKPKIAPKGATVGTTTVKKTTTKHYKDNDPYPQKTYPGGYIPGKTTYTPPKPDYKRPKKMKAVLPYTITEPAQELCEIFAVKRPDGSHAEKTFVDTYLLGQLKTWKPKKDRYGNLHVVVPYPIEFKDKRLVLFSSHTDTVHRDGGEQKIFIDTNLGHACIRPEKEEGWGGHCLGADDGTGVWLMMNMIRKGVPGYYIFHRAEECGGKGSRFISNNYAEIFAEYITNGKSPFDIAIAFDRKSTFEVITHQQGGRCASDTSGKWLCDALNKHGHDYQLSTHGSFTDTANYKDFIPECFNLGVGYYKQHGPNEVQDLIFAEFLLEALCKIAWEDMPFSRDPKAVTKTQRGHWPKTKGKKHYMGGLYDEKVSQSFLDTVLEDDVPRVEDMMDTIASSDDLIDFISLHPLAVLKALKDFDLTEMDLLRYIEETSGSNALTDRLIGRTRGKKKTLL